MYLLVKSNYGKYKFLDEDESYEELFKRSHLPMVHKNKIDTPILTSHNLVTIIFDEKREIVEVIRHLYEHGKTITYANKDRLKKALDHEGIKAEFIKDKDLRNTYLVVRI